jgi:hypothetical protein
MNENIQKTRRAFLNTVYKSGLSIALGRFALFTPVVFAFGQVPAKLDDDKSIFELQGTATVDGKKATMSTFIKADSLVVTASNSFIIFKVGQDSHILRENSTLQLEGNNVLESGLHLISGKILSVFAEREGSQNKHTLRTSTATIGIRGTGVYAESDPEMSYLCTCYGKTKIQANAAPDQVELIAAQHHDAPRFILKDPEKGKLIIPAPVFNHTDEELILLEAIVGRESPISAIQSYSSPRRGY